MSASPACFSHECASSRLPKLVRGGIPGHQCPCAFADPQSSARSPVPILSIPICAVCWRMTPHYFFAARRGLPEVLRRQPGRETTHLSRSSRSGRASWRSFRWRQQAKPSYLHAPRGRELRVAEVAKVGATHSSTRRRAGGTGRVRVMATRGLVGVAAGLQVGLS